MRYSYTQRGYGAAIVLGCAYGFVALLMGVIGISERERSLVWITLAGLTALFVVIGIMCTVLRIQVDRRELRWSFGLGFPAYRLPLDEVETIRIVPNNFVTGYGVRLMPGGVLYNVGGKRALEITRREQGRIRIATDDPEGLLAAIEGERQPVSSPGPVTGRA